MIKRVMCFIVKFIFICLLFKLRAAQDFFDDVIGYLLFVVQRYCNVIQDVYLILSEVLYARSCL